MQKKKSTFTETNVFRCTAQERENTVCVGITAKAGYKWGSSLSNYPQHSTSVPEMWRCYEKSWYFLMVVDESGFMPREGVSLSSACGSSSGGAVKTLCSAAFSHTVIRIRRADLYHRNIFPRFRGYYLTCSYDPPAKSTKEILTIRHGRTDLHYFWCWGG